MSGWDIMMTALPEWIYWVVGIGFGSLVIGLVLFVAWIVFESFDD